MKKNGGFNIYSFLGKKFACPLCPKEHHIPIRKLITEKGVIPSLSPIISSLVKGKKILILSDKNTDKVAGRKCAEVLEKEYRVSSLVLSAGRNERVHAEEKYLAGILKRLADKDAILTVGSGSITDLGKYAADNLKIPLVSFPTAPSMNAYTSGVAAFLSGGLKKTVSVKPAVGVITDLDTISRAPLDLLKSGFADSLAKSFANADWKISSLITGEDFCMLPFKITAAAENSYINDGKGLVTRNKEIIARLMEGLNLGGLSMVIAGASSPASGGEHLISHFLDMIAHKQKRETFSYHGLQVGLGTMVSAAIYERLKLFSTRDVVKRLRCNAVDYNKSAVFYARNNLEITKEFEKKLPLLKKLRNNLPSLWNQIKKEAFALTYPAEKLKKALKEAGCPLNFSEIGVDKKLTFQAIAYSRFIRGRLTILDVADELGILSEIAEEFR